MLLNIRGFKSIKISISKFCEILEIGRDGVTRVTIFWTLVLLTYYLRIIGFLKRLSLSIRRSLLSGSVEIGRCSSRNSSTSTSSSVDRRNRRRRSYDRKLQFLMIRDELVIFTL
jgi:hypothetical protein